MTRVIVDTDHLVAYFNRSHRGVVDQTAPPAPPQITCGSALTEACFPIQRAVGKPAYVLGKVSQGSLASGIDVADDASSNESLMRRCADTPMCLVDACLVRLPERLPNPAILLPEIGK